MFVRQSKSKRNGKEHRTFQIAESYRDDKGKVKQRTLLHLGPADKFLEKDIDTLINGLLKIKGVTPDELELDADHTKPFGQIWAIMHLWKELKISQAIARNQQQTNIEFDLESHLKCLVFNRLDDPSSKLKLLTWLEEVYIPGINRTDIRYEYLLRAMDFLIEHKPEIEDTIAVRMLNLFNQELKICFYDLTSSYFEAESSIQPDDIRQYGYSRDHRSDREQIVIGVVMTKDGIPLLHYTFAGNTADCSTLKEVIKEIKERFGTEKLIVVADKGLLSGANLEYLIDSGIEFILGESIRQNKTAREIIKSASESKAKEVVEDGSYIYESRRERTSKIKELIEGRQRYRTYTAELRYVAMYNPQVAEKRQMTRKKAIEDALMEIEFIQKKDITVADCYHQIKGYLERKRLSKFFEVKLEQGRIRINENKEEIQYERTGDGWFLVVTRNEELDKQSIIDCYKELKYVEHGFYELKHSLKLRPNYHWTEKRIRAHVMVCFIAFQIGVLFEKRLLPMQMTWERAMEKLRDLTVIEWNVEERNRVGLIKTNKEQMTIFNHIGARKPTITSL